MALLPPLPVGVPPGHSYWNDWYEKLRYLINSSGITVTWSNIDFTGSNITSIATRNHNDLQNIQGGTSGEYYHLTAAQHTDLTDGGSSTSHTHDHGGLGGLSDNDHPQYLLVTDIDDVPVNGETAQPISSNWAFDHVAAADPHTGYRLESADHTHQSTGLQGGQLDHGLALTGLTDDDHTQYLLANGNRALTADWDAGSFEIRAQTFESDVVTGTAPLVIASTTKVDNLHVARATLGDTVTVANEAADTTCFPLFGTAATGNLEPKTNANYTFNSSTGALAVPSLSLTTALPITSGGTGATTASAARTNLGLEPLTYPLMNYGGVNFGGPVENTDYLDANPLTGIANSKVGSIVIIVRFASASSATERLISSTSTSFSVVRTAAGTIEVQAESTTGAPAGAQILLLRSSSAQAASAGTYVIMASWDLASAGSGRIYVNEVAGSAITYTNDTISYAVAEYGIGGSADGGTAKFEGDLYTIWFDPTQRLEFNTESVRRKFIDANLVPLFLGLRGELPTGTSPILFLGYDSYPNWTVNRGTGTGTFTVNGTPVTATTTLYGQYMPTQRNSSGLVITKAGTPTTSDIADGEWAIYKDSSGGSIRLWTNDGGTMKSTTLTDTGVALA